MDQVLDSKHTQMKAVTPLTKREIEAVRLLALDGLCDKEAASAMSISIRTLRAHVGSVRRKTGKPTRLAAIVTAVTGGLVTSDNSAGK